MEDEALVRDARAGDLAAVEMLLGRYQRLAYTTALRLLGEPAEAEDTAQDALIRAFTYLSELREGEAFAPWLRRIAVNLSLNVLRRRGRLRFQSLDADDDAAHDASAASEFVDVRAVSPEEEILRDDLQAEVEALLARLPEEQRSALLLRDAYNYDLAEIAALQGCGLSAAKMRVSRARKAFRQLMVEADLPAVTA
jgi:RNA polymerase sigma-70 factor, ECF subfamily